MALRLATATFVLTLTLLGSTAFAQQPTAADAVNRFLSLNASGELQTAEGRGLRTGEASEWDVPTIGPLPDHHDRLVEIVEGEAVVRVAARPPGGDPVDLYFYVRSDQQGWQVSAMRTLALPPFLYMLIDQLDAQPSRSTEQDRQLENLRLVTQSDAELHRWFSENQLAIQALVEAYERLPSGSGRIGDDGDSALEVSAALRALYLSQIFAEEDRLVLLIGGIMDNSVGVMRTVAPPPISSSEYIWVEPLADGWFLFKTT